MGGADLTPGFAPGLGAREGGPGFGARTGGPGFGLREGGPFPATEPGRDEGGEAEGELLLRLDFAHEGAADPPLVEEGVGAAGLGAGGGARRAGGGGAGAATRGGGRSSR